ncbi:hypothetical protein I2486_19885 [Cellulophaga sp. E16_2]|uniref:hypothetical protein n=1 Tax=unclassified Cellulophaga TaxID=2634405 RepID=UPI0013FD87F0|nr:MULTISPECIES: hypothetical protein [unclassified Cellulophaga]MBO0593666.1 hypothetical protein [Cellulophaga sp. E16_2]
MMKFKLVCIFFILPFLIVAQDESDSIEAIIKEYQENYANNSEDFSIKLIDIDNDSDLDYIFSFGCGEGNCLRVHLNTNGAYKKVIDEFGVVSIDFMDSKNNEASKLILNSVTNHCCGESPFGSHRVFSFAADEVHLKNNYVSYNHDDYNDEDNYRLELLPAYFLDEAYEVRIMTDNYNVRFSADLNSHNASFTCEEQTNIIAKLYKGAVVNVLAAHRGNDHEERTWLYVEISNEAINDDAC